jgi:adenylyltransferase/sulfurtransferase
VTTDLSDAERERYSSQISGDLGPDGQLVLKRSRAIVIGAGALGSAAAAQLVSSGVGYVAIVDGGVVELRDLAGQALYYTPDVGSGKAETLAAKLSLLNPEVQVESYPVAPDEENAGAIVAGHDVVLVATRDGAVAEAVTTACVASGIPFICASTDVSDAVAGTTAGAEAIALLVASTPEEALR